MYVTNAALAAETEGSRSWEALKALAHNPVIFGIGVGIAHGLIATMRKKPVTKRATLVAALVTGAGEAALVESDDPMTLLRYGLLSAFGATLGLAVFTRWDPYSRAIVELDEVPAPPLPPELQRAIAAY